MAALFTGLVSAADLILFGDCYANVMTELRYIHNQ